MNMSHLAVKDDVLDLEPTQQDEENDFDSDDEPQANNPVSSEPPSASSNILQLNSGQPAQGPVRSFSALFSWHEEQVSLFWVRSVSSINRKRGNKPQEPNLNRTSTTSLFNGTHSRKTP